MNPVIRYQCEIHLDLCASVMNRVFELLKQLPPGSITKHRFSIAEHVREYVFSELIAESAVPQDVQWLNQNGYTAEQCDLMINFPELTCTVYLSFRVRESDYTMLRLIQVRD